MGKELFNPSSVSKELIEVNYSAMHVLLMSLSFINEFPQLHFSVLTNNLANDQSKDRVTNSCELISSMLLDWLLQ